MVSEKLLEGWSFRLNWQPWLSWDGREVTLPHDFMLGTQRTPDSPTGADYGYFQPCRGTYIRKITKSPEEVQMLSFDGVMGLCEVFVNRERVCFHPYGYTPFLCDISRYLHEGENELRVEVDAACQPASRWYTGAGIYREVELLKSGRDHFAPWGLSVKVRSIEGDSAVVDFSAKILSSCAQTGEISLCIPEIGFELIRSVWLEEGENSFDVRCVLHGVSSWSPETPVLYEVEAQLATREGTDSARAGFGVRTVVCDPEQGLLLNGRPIKLYGSCNHHDNGIVGAASYRSAEERRVRILKESGFNAIRCAHNPPSKVMLDVCDKMGMLVIDEIFDCWKNGKKAYDYHLWFDRYAKEDIAAMVLRDRNHPSVILWSTGNEIYERAGKCGGYALGRMIAEEIRREDDTRPLTHAFCDFWDSPEYAGENKDGDLPPGTPDFWCRKIGPQAGNLEVLGYNYLTHRIPGDEKVFSSHLFVVTESYPMDAVWVKGMMDSHKKLIGEFVWTGWDYFGETGLGHRVYGVDTTPGWGLTQCPEHISNCGDFSICGFKKPASYYRDAAWGRAAVRILSVAPENTGRPKAFSAWGFYDAERTWTYPGEEGRISEVQLYTAAAECELWLNGVSLGRKAPDEKGVARFEVAYAPGRLEAAAYGADKAVLGRDELRTVGEGVSLRIVPDSTGRTGAPDLIFVEIDLCDREGNIAWTAEDEVTVTAQGGTVVGTGSGRTDDPHDYTSPVCRAYRGRLLAAVRPEHPQVTITAKSAGREDSVIYKYQIL